MYRFSTYLPYYKANLKLALPIVFTQLGQILTQFADNLMVGQYGGEDPLPLAAVSLGGAVFFLLFIAAIGITMGLTPLVGELYAQGKLRRAASLLHNGVLFYTLLGIVIATLQWLSIPLLYRMGQPVEVVNASLPYYQMLVASMPFVMLFFAFKQFLEGVGNTRAQMVTTLLANLLNIGLNWLFIFGHCGVPELGATGAGLATLIARIAASALLVGYFLRHPIYRRYFTGFSLKRITRTASFRLLQIGVPISMQMFLESSAFVFIGIMMGWFGERAAISLSASHITTTLGNCAFMIVTSIGAATTIRTSFCYGMRDWQRARQTAIASYHLVMVWNTLAALVFILLRHQIPALFTTNPEVIALAGHLLVAAAIYQLSDGIQNISVSILRGLQDVRIIMPIALIAYWLINLPIGYLLGFTYGMGPVGLYLSVFFGLTGAAILMIFRIQHTFRKLASDI